MSDESGSPPMTRVERCLKGVRIGRRNSREVAPVPAGERTRRGLLAGAAGALGLLAGETILSAAPAQANAGDNVVLGHDNTSDHETIIDTRQPASGASPPALSLIASVPSGSAALNVFNLESTSGVGSAIYASSDVEGLYALTGLFGLLHIVPPPGTRNAVFGITTWPVASGVRGQAVNGGAGVTGVTTTTGIGALPGVDGVNLGSGPAVRGESNGGAAVYGLAPNNSEGLYAQSGPFPGTTPGATSNGVHAVTDSHTDSGVWGEALGGGFGVSGTTATKGPDNPAGVYGANQGTGAGVKGFAANGTGLYGLASTSGVAVQATNSGGGTALAVSGRSVFNRSGVVTITAPATTAAVTVPGGLTAAALVLALLQTSAAGIWVTAAVPDAAAGQIKIELNAAPSSPAAVQVAWFVVN